MSSRSRLRAQYPEFESTTDYPDSTVDDFISWAADELSSSVWDNLYEAGVVSLAAHLLKVSDLSSDGGAGAGPVESKSVGPVSVSYDVDSGDSDSNLTSTKYGREHARLKKKVAAGTAGFDRVT